MQQMLKTQKDEENTPATGQSAFHQPCQFGKSPTLLPAQFGSHRDSGYGTDFSPASVVSNTRRFTYEDSEVDELANEMEELDIFPDNEVFNEGCSETIFECSETDDADKEVEGLLSTESNPRHPVSQPIEINRPSAPIPTPEEIMENGDDVVNDDRCDGSHVSEQWCHMTWTLSRERIIRNRFRPIASRSVGTQTPSPHGQIITEAMTPGNVVGRPFARGNALTRLRLRSESEDMDRQPPLPDIVPMSRDRSISLPDVPSFRRREQEQEVGRELRRISDEFNSSFARRRERPAHRYASSFPLVVNIDFHAYLTSLRRILSSSPLFQPRATKPNNDDAHR